MVPCGDFDRSILSRVFYVSSFGAEKGRWIEGWVGLRKLESSKYLGRGDGKCRYRYYCLRVSVWRTRRWLWLEGIWCTCVGLLHRVFRAFLRFSSFAGGKRVSACISCLGDSKLTSKPESEELESSSKPPSLQNEYSDDMVDAFWRKDWIYVTYGIVY